MWKWRNEKVFEDKEWSLQQKLEWIGKQEMEIRRTFPKAIAPGRTQVLEKRIRKLEDEKFSELEMGSGLLDGIGEGEERRLVHVFREQNVVANWLAQRSVVGSEERIAHNKPPLGCIKLVQNDRIGGVVVRYIHEEE
nr:hypothetical protein Iba_chr12fCG7010 [Ipomoea batatas]